MLSPSVRLLCCWSLVLFSMTVVALTVTACQDQSPIKIGFVGGLTGRVADLGVAGRNGVMLAVEERNRAGGINGRSLELIVRDDRQDAGSARQVINELIDAGVVAIIGPMTSSVAVEIQPLINDRRMIMISPTVKTDQLSGQDDYFLRVSTPLSSNAEKMATYAAQEMKLKRFAVVYDVSNRAFTETWLNVFRKKLEKYGGEITVAKEFISKPNVHFMPIAEDVLATDPEAVLLLSNAIDTAMLAQQIRKLGSEVTCFSSEWASTTDVLSFGGRAVDGMTSFHSFNSDSRNPDYLSFRDSHVERFGSLPSFATTLAYDAASFLFTGLSRKANGKGLRDSLLTIGTFPGLQSDVTVDRFGDVERKLFLTVIENGQFKVVE